MIILGIDPGEKDSAYVIWDSLAGHILHKDILPNEQIFELLNHSSELPGPPTVLAIEVVRGYGLRVGNETFKTCEWAGIFMGGSHLKRVTLSRKEIASHLCDNPQAGDVGIRRALIDRFGPPGTKSNPGNTHGLKTHLWAALAVAAEKAERENPRPDISPNCLSDRLRCP